MASARSGRTLQLEGGLDIKELDERHYIDFTDYLYNCKAVKQQQGRVLVQTNPTEQHQDAHIINPGFSNGFVGALYRAYNEHRHLVLRPDDVWLAITAGFGLFMNVPENAELMRKHFVQQEGKIQLEVNEEGTIYTVNWTKLINQMSDFVEKNTKGDARSWIEPNFSTTTPVARTVGQVVLMGVMKHYFNYKFKLRCGLPKVTLEGTEEDWQQLQKKARRFATFGVDCLTHWAGLLDVILQKLVDSRAGNVDKTFWSHVTARESWGSGPRYISGWLNVFMPFTEKGAYRLDEVKPETSEWGRVDHNDVPPSAVEVPVTIDDNGREYQTIFYGGHIVCLYKATDNTIRPSVDWAMIDVTGSPGPQDGKQTEPVADRVENYNPQAFPKPDNFSYGA